MVPTGPTLTTERVGSPADVSWLWEAAVARGAAPLGADAEVCVTGDLDASVAARGVRGWTGRRAGGVVPAKTLPVPPTGAVVLLDLRLLTPAGRDALGLPETPDTGRIVAHESWHAAVYGRGEPLKGPQHRRRMPVRDAMHAFYAWQGMDEHRVEKAVMLRWSGPSAHHANLMDAVDYTRRVARRSPEEAFNALGVVTRLVGEAAAETLTGTGGPAAVDAALWDRTVEVFSRVPEAGRPSTAEVLDPLCLELSALLGEWCTELGFVVKEGRAGTQELRVLPIR